MNVYNVSLGVKIQSVVCRKFGYYYFYLKRKVIAQKGHKIKLARQYKIKKLNYVGCNSTRN